MPDFQKMRDQFMHLVHTTPIEVAIGAVAGGLVLGVYSYRDNIAHSGERPVGYSEVGKTVKAFAKEGKTLSPVMMAGAHCSDGLTKVNEANNLAFERGNDHDVFASELEYKMEPALKVHRTIPEEAAAMNGVMPAALKALDKYSQALRALPPISSTLDRIWSHSSRDVYETYPCTETYTDSKGKTQTRWTTCKRYDHTVHTYRYDEDAAAQATTSLNGYLGTLPDLAVDVAFVQSKETDPDNEYAVERSYKRELDGRLPSKAEVLAKSNLFITASNFFRKHDALESNQQQLKPLTQQWAQMFPSEHDYRYSTHSSFDDGPPGYQLVNRLLSTTRTIELDANSVVGGLQQCQTQLNQIVALNKEYIGVVKDRKPGRNPDDIRADIMTAQETGYKAYFSEGPKQDPFSVLEVTGFTMGGLLAGGLLGLGADQLIARRLQRRRFESEGETPVRSAYKGPRF